MTYRQYFWNGPAGQVTEDHVQPAKRCEHEQHQAFYRARPLAGDVEDEADRGFKILAIFYLGKYPAGMEVKPGLPRVNHSLCSGRSTKGFRP